MFVCCAGLKDSGSSWSGWSLHSDQFRLRTRTGGPRKFDWFQTLRKRLPSVHPQLPLLWKGPGPEAFFGKCTEIWKGEIFTFFYIFFFFTTCTFLLRPGQCILYFFLSFFPRQITSLWRTLVSIQATEPAKSMRVSLTPPVYKAWICLRKGSFMWAKGMDQHAILQSEKSLMLVTVLTQHAPSMVSSSLQWKDNLG